IVNLFAIRYSLFATSVRHEAHRFVERAKHAVEFVAALEDEARRRNDAVDALAARETRIFFDAVNGDFRGAPEHREHRAVLEEVDGVTAPFAGRHLGAVESEDAAQFPPLEGHVAGGDGRGTARLAPADLAGFGFAKPEGHAAPPCERGFMIAL